MPSTPAKKKAPRRVDLKAWRTELGLSRQAAAEALGISRHTVKAYELKARPVPQPIISLMRRIFEDTDRARRPHPVRILSGPHIASVTNDTLVLTVADPGLGRAVLAQCLARDVKASHTQTSPEEPQRQDHWLAQTTADATARAVFWLVPPPEDLPAQAPWPESSRPHPIARLAAARPDLITVVLCRPVSGQDHAISARAALCATGASFVLLDDPDGPAIILSTKGQTLADADRELVCAALLEMVLSSLGIAPAQP